MGAWGSYLAWPPLKRSPCTSGPFSPWRTGPGSCSSWPSLLVKATRFWSLAQAVANVVLPATPRCTSRWPNSLPMASCWWGYGVLGAQQGWQDKPKMQHPVGRHWNCSLQYIVFAGEKVNGPGLVQPQERCCAYFSSLSICITSNGSLISSRMAAMALAGSVLCLLARGHAQAYCENMSVQQNRYLVMTLASPYCSRPDCTAVGTQGWTWWSATTRSSSAWDGAEHNSPQWPGPSWWRPTPRATHCLEAQASVALSTAGTMMMSSSYMFDSQSWNGEGQCLHESFSYTFSPSSASTLFPVSGFSASLSPESSMLVIGMV